MYYSCGKRSLDIYLLNKLINYIKMYLKYISGIHNHMSQDI